MEEGIKKYERVALWAVVIGVGIYAISLNGTIGTLEEQLAEQNEKLDRPVVEGTVIPGIPGPLAEVWKKSLGEEKAVEAGDYRWLTVRLDNTGYAWTGELVADLSVAPNIAQVFAYTADGKALDASWGGPELKAGGTGENTVSVAFPSFKPAQKHFLFVGVSPSDPVFAGAGDAADWAENGSRYWSSLSVKLTSTGTGEPALADIDYGHAAKSMAMSAAGSAPTGDAGEPTAPATGEPAAPAAGEEAG